VQIVGTPQFAPDGNIVFYGTDGSAAGLFTVSLEPAEPFLLIPSVEGEGGWAFSSDGSFLAYMEYDRDDGEARLFIQNLSMGNIELLGTLPIPRGSGSALPQLGNLNWSADGAIVAFDFGLYPSDRAIYLAYTDGSGLVKVVEGGHAPTISADGRCLAYISNKQVFLMDLTQVSSTSAMAAPMFLADLPAGRGRADSRLDKLQWQP
jgi:Tol biopolymer transport system component